MTVEAILFDVGGVIVAPVDRQDVWKKRDELGRELGFADGREMWLHFYESEAWTAAKTGKIVHEELWDALLRPLGLTDRRRQAQFVADLHAGEGMDPRIEALIRSLHGRYRLGILSNWDDRLESILEEQLEISHYFDVILNSYRIGVAKPDEQAFRIALERLGADPQDVFFIDDQERNTRVAAALGIKTHTFDDPPALVADLQERSILGADWVPETAG
jgi:putative hydrolase of the HAD superfamily